MSPSAPWSVCTSSDVDTTVIGWAESSQRVERGYAAKFTHFLELLLISGPLIGAKKIGGVDRLWEYRIGDHRVFFSFADRRRIAVAVIRRKLQGSFPQEVYQHIASQVQRFVEEVDATGSVGCPGDEEERR